MKVYDCFPFFNEFDVLELRLKTLWDHVDWFVLVEAPWTFQGKPKPLHFKERHAEFRKWLPKIRHVVISGEIDTINAWHREYATREAMKGGFEDADPDDLIFQSDCDEIWRPEKKLAQLDNGQHYATFEQEMFYYALNAKRDPEIVWYGTRRCRAKDWPGGQNLRWTRQNLVGDGGWHFSFLGDAANASEKMKAFSHVEYSGDWWTDVERIERSMSQGVDLIQPSARYVPVEVDETFPKPLLEDPERWRKHLRPVAH